MSKRKIINDPIAQHIAEFLRLHRQQFVNLLGPTHKVFVRGGAATSDERHKSLEINGLRMIPQFIWLSRDVVKEMVDNG